GRALDPSILTRLPPRSHLPFLARQWDQVFSASASSWRGWDGTRGGPGRWEWALGPRRDQPNFERERRRVATAVIDLTLATTRELTRHGGGELPTWARAHLARHAARGICVYDQHDAPRPVRAHRGVPR